MCECRLSARRALVRRVRGEGTHPVYESLALLLCRHGASERVYSSGRALVVVLHGEDGGGAGRDVEAVVEGRSRGGVECGGAEEDVGRIEDLFLCEWREAVVSEGSYERKRRRTKIALSEGEWRKR